MPSLLLGGDLDMARWIAPRMRLADRLEIERGAGCEPLEGLRRSLDGSRNTFHMEHNGEPFALGGCGPIPGRPDIGSPWMLGTDAIKRHWVWFLRHTPDVWATVSHQYDLLWNLVDARNAVHVRWLEWSGCRFIGRRELHGNPFREFIKTPCASPSRPSRSP